MQASLTNRSFARLTLVASSLFFLAGCQQPEVMERLSAAPEPFPIAGQVFVVTPEGGSVTLGSVRVQIFETEPIAAHLEEKDREIAVRQREQRQQLAELEKLAEVQMKRKSEAEQSYEKRLQAMRDQVSELNAEVQKKVEAIQRQIVSNQEFIEFVSTFPAPPEGIPLQSEFEIYQAQRVKWLSMSAAERKAWQTVLVNLNEDLRAEQQQLKGERDGEIAKFEQELQGLVEEIGAAERERAAIAAKAEEVRAKLRQPPESSVYLAGMPRPVKETRTDANGEFRVEFDSPSDYVVFVQAHRLVNNEPVDLIWLIRVEARERGRLLLSNHNLIGTDSSENLVEFAIPDPEANI